MPELPEVECVRAALAARVVGRRVAGVTVRRAEVVRPAEATRRSKSPYAGAKGPALKQLKAKLLAGQRITGVQRHGKQLALVGERGCVGVHLGMSGTVTLDEPAANATDELNHPAGRADSGGLPPHTHLTWRLEAACPGDKPNQSDAAPLLHFRDPRRFGGVWVAGALNELISLRWSELGPDALVVRPSELHAGLSRTSRGLKPALLDQSVVAGLGNIYVDEALFRAKLHPLTPGNGVSMNKVQHLVRVMRSLLAEAIERGGTTLRDYTGLDREAGSFGRMHRVYGRAGEPCVRCGAKLSKQIIAGRSSVFCTTCQV